MAEWPTVEAVKQSLGVTTSDRDGLIASAVQAAIEQVAVDLGYRNISVSEESESPGNAFVLTASVYSVDADQVGSTSDPAEVEPTNSLSNAALILAVMAVKAPEAPFGIAAVFDLGALRVAANHPTYLRMLTGHRFRFGVG